MLEATHPAGDVHDGRWQQAARRRLRSVRLERGPPGDGPTPRLRFDQRPRWQTYAYDWLGNTTSTGDDASGFYDRSLGTIGHEAARPYQLRGARVASGERAGALEAAYDEAGQLVRMDVRRDGPCLPAGARCSHRYAYTWDEAGRLVRARRWDVDGTTLGGGAGSSTSTNPLPGTTPEDALPLAPPAVELRYGYDGADERVQKTSVDAAGAERHTLYVFGTLELRRARWVAETDDYEVTEETVVAYLEAHGVRLARLHLEAADRGEPRLGGARLHVLLSLGDALGSARAVIDRATSELVEAGTFQPYGARESDYLRLSTTYQTAAVDAVRCEPAA